MIEIQEALPDNRVKDAGSHYEVSIPKVGTALIGKETLFKLVRAGAYKISTRVLPRQGMSVVALMGKTSEKQWLPAARSVRTFADDHCHWSKPWPDSYLDCRISTRGRCLERYERAHPLPEGVLIDPEDLPLVEMRKVSLAPLREGRPPSATVTIDGRPVPLHNHILGEYAVAINDNLLDCRRGNLVARNSKFTSEGVALDGGTILLDPQDIEWFPRLHLHTFAEIDGEPFVRIEGVWTQLSIVMDYLCGPLPFHPIKDELFGTWDYRRTNLKGIWTENPIVASLKAGGA